MVHQEKDIAHIFRTLNKICKIGKSIGTKVDQLSKETKEMEDLNDQKQDRDRFLFEHVGNIVNNIIAMVEQLYEYTKAIIYTENFKYEFKFESFV